jgi:hypothetical protein
LVPLAEESNVPRGADLLKSDLAEMALSSSASLEIGTGPATVFIAYSSDDRARVKPLVELLERAGWRVWWDQKLGAGTLYQQEIERALEGAGCVVVVWSKNSVKSDWVLGEADEGRKRQILVPVVLDSVPPPIQFRTRHTVDLSRWYGGHAPEVEKILRSVEDLLGSPMEFPKRPGSSEVLTGASGGPVIPSRATSGTTVEVPARNTMVVPVEPLEPWLRGIGLIQCMAHVVVAISVFINRDYPMITGPILAVAGIATAVLAGRARLSIWRNTALGIGIFGALLGIMSFFFAMKGFFELLVSTLALGTTIGVGVLIPELLKNQGGEA